jgi:hypothetical protein
MTPAQFWQLEQQNQQNLQRQGQQNTNNMVSAISQFAEMYQGMEDKSAALKGMDTAMGSLADIGVLPKGFLNKYNQLDDQTRPFIYQALVQPMFQSYNAGQSAAAQAQAWDKYKKTWGGEAGGQPDGWTVY